ncbi:MAG: type II toxin-antitoxin system RelE/ParE family toxin [Clostridia bacterium]|nr:type II toxin-antitoxin system RelE/ParE family toxin [Clostridia bacterium]
MHKIVYLPLAMSDISDAAEYIAFVLESPQAAEALLAELDKAVQMIAQFPYAHELYRTSRPMLDEIRKMPVKGYVLYYAVFDDRVEIRRFLHGRRERGSIPV